MWQWFLDLDIQLNEFLGGNKGETISSRLGRKIEDKNCWTCRIFCRVYLIPVSIILWLRGKGFHWKHCREYIQEEYR